METKITLLLPSGHTLILNCHGWIKEVVPTNQCDIVHDCCSSHPWGRLLCPMTLAIVFSIHSRLPFANGSRFFHAAWIRVQITQTIRRSSSVLESKEHGTKSFPSHSYFFPQKLHTNLLSQDFCPTWGRRTSERQIGAWKPGWFFADI